jgi:hypothetical protein
MLELHPEFLKKNGKHEFVVLPYEEFVEVQRRLEDAEDVLELRRAKQQDASQPTVPLDEVKRRLGCD